MNILKEEVEVLNKRLSEPNEDELAQVIYGIAGMPDLPFPNGSYSASSATEKKK